VRRLRNDQPPIYLHTVHSGIVWRDKIYGDRRQICENVEVSTVKYELFTRPKMKYLLFTLNI
jgi:hypothetical protein